MSEAPVICVIPARYGSTRLPGKPLLDLGGWPVIEWVYRRASAAEKVARVIVATDDERIARVVRGFGGDVVMTTADCRNGTERVAEATSGEEASVIINLQGDEPRVDPAMLDDLVEVFRKEPGVRMATLMRRLAPEEDEKKPSLVKVVVDRRGYALYFSRHPIPFHRDASSPKPTYFGHYGIYAFRPETLRDYAALPPSPLEEAEKLEQLRALGAGIPIRVIETRFHGIGLDTPADLEALRALVEKEGLKPG